MGLLKKSGLITGKQGRMRWILGKGKKYCCKNSRRAKEAEMKEEQLRKLLIGIKWFVVAVMVLLLYILYVKIQEKVRIQETKEDMVWQSYLEIMSRDVDSGSIPTKEEK